MIGPGAGFWLAAASGTIRTVRRLRWLRMPEPWIVLLVILPAVIAGAWALYRLERASLRAGVRRALAALRAAALLGVIAILFDPTLIVERVERRDSTILVLLDESHSMAIRDAYADPAHARFARTVGGGEADRLAIAEGILVRQGLLDALRRKGDLLIQGFAGDVRPLADLPRGEGSAIPEIPFRPRGDMTRLADAIAEAVENVRGRRVAGLVLLSDGAQNGGVLEPAAVASRLAKREIPIFAVGIGNPDPPKDIALANLESSDVALVGDRIPFDVTVTSEGFAGETVAVRIELDGMPLASDAVELADGRRSLRIEHRLSDAVRPGTYTLTARVESRPGELFDDNNAVERPLRVLDQKIRVIYVEGLPRYEYRHLKSALIRDPTMRCQCLLASADPGFVQESSDGVPPLARFPATKAELFEAHVLIIGDVDPRFFSASELDLIAEFVADGGGIVFIAGESFNPQAYPGTPLGKVLPVEIEEGDSPIRPREPIAEPFRVALTREGTRHLAMRLVNDPEENRDLWEDVDGIPYNSLPGFYWFAVTKRPKPAAIPLAVHPTRKHIKYGPRTIFAYENYAKGRAFFSAVDETWRWRSDPRADWNYRFWGQVIRFVATGKLLGKTPRFSISTEKIAYTVGERVHIAARVLDRDYEPAREAGWPAWLCRPGADPATPERIELAAVPGRPGSYEGEIEANRIGAYEVWIGAEGEKEAFKVFRAEVPQREKLNPRMDRETLESLARISGGRYYGMEEAMRLADDVPSLVEEIPIASAQHSAWDRPLVVLVLAAVLAAEWIVRKLKRLA